MKTFLIASAVGIALGAGSAMAADIPAKAPAPAPVANWTGCYVNGGAGYGMWKQNHYGEEGPSAFSFAPLTQDTPTVSTGGEGWLGAVGAGCDYQAGSRFLIGVFGDYDFMSLTGSFQQPFTGWIGNETERGAWAVGGRIGYLVTPRLLTYVNAGYTQARFGQINLLSDATPQVVPPACGASPCTISPHTYAGWFIGGGTEYALADILPIQGLFWRTEYRYAGYGSADLPILNSTGGLVPVCGADHACGDHMQKNVQTITSGLVWRFNFGGPIATRY